MEDIAMIEKNYKNRDIQNNRMQVESIVSIDYWHRLQTTPLGLILK
jgi:hypothetical protein